MTEQGSNPLPGVPLSRTHAGQPGSRSKARIDDAVFSSGKIAQAAHILGAAFSDGSSADQLHIDVIRRAEGRRLEPNTSSRIAARLNAQQGRQVPLVERHHGAAPDDSLRRERCGIQRTLPAQALTRSPGASHRSAMAPHPGTLNEIRGRQPTRVSL